MEELHPEIGYEEQTEERPARRLLPVIIAMLAAVALAGFLLAAYFTFMIEEVTVTGSELYPEEQIERVVLVGDGSHMDLRRNAFYLPVLYHHRKITNVPFVDSIHVEMKSFSSVKIQVTEKKATAYVHAGGSNVYIGRDGKVLQISDRVLPDVPKIQNMEVRRAVQGETLEAERTAAVSQVLEALQILRKYEMQSKTVRVEESGGISIMCGDVRVLLGDADYDIKIAKIRELRGQLEDRKGLIDMRTYIADGRDIILQPEDGKGGK
ncbi:MAG: cell division protein FtsQ/DivIB [Lachnospiraceae bacterium]|nr:cell division protein FtsQ/DivIB [Lachnospiraceae bacterium]